MLIKKFTIFAEIQPLIMVKRIVISPDNTKAIEFFDRLSARKARMRADTKAILAYKKSLGK